MSSKESAARLPDFFADRSLGKQSARRLRLDLEWTVRLLSDVYPHDAQDVADEDWIRFGCDQGWTLLTKDQRIRYREHELAALAPHAFLFCLSNGNLTLDQQFLWFQQARPRIEAAVRRGRPGFWLIYARGRIERKWSAP